MIMTIMKTMTTVNVRYKSLQWRATEKCGKIDTHSRRRSNSDFFCSVGESGEGGLSLSMIVGPAASIKRWGLARIWDRRSTSKTTFSQPFKETGISWAVRIASIIIFHLSKLWKAKFFILCDVTFLVRLQGKIELDHPNGRRGANVQRHLLNFQIDLSSVTTEVKALSEYRTAQE